MGVGQARVQSKLLCRLGLGRFLEMHHILITAKQRVGWSFAMDGRLTRRSAVCRRDWSGRTIVPRTHKCLRTRSKSGVLSGFPTALEPTLPRCLPGTNASALRSDRKAGQFLLRHDDIPPPPPIVVALGVCRLRLARIYVSSCPSSSIKGAVWEGRREFFLGGIRKSIVREDRLGVMCDQRRIKSGKKPAVGRNHFLPILRRPPM